MFIPVSLTEKNDDGYGESYHLADNCSKSCSYHSHLGESQESEYHYGIQDNVRNGTRHGADHGSFHISRGLQYLLYYDLDIDKE